MRNLAITVMSVILTTFVIGNAYYQKKQFYPSVVYITKSNPSMAIIYIQAFVIVIIVGKLMQKIFFGELRAVELEHLMERSWYAVTETCLAFTVFRDDFNPKFLALFTLLLFLKAFHWLADERVDYMERSPVISWLFHIRIVSLLIILGILDALFVCRAYQSTLNKGASVQLVFGFEYAILLTIVLNIIIKYAFHLNDFHELPWDNKAVFLLYTELIMGFIKVILYFSFVMIMVRIYTLPLFAFRPMYYTVRAFKKAVNDVIMSRRAIRNMNTLYPDATVEELAAMDNVCIICREEMRSAAKKLPCNHIFHTSCLRSWFQRQQTCPTCRLNILRTPATNNGGPQGGAVAAGIGAAAGGAAAPAAAGVGAHGAAVAGVAAAVGQPPRIRENLPLTNITNRPDALRSGAGQIPRLRDRTAQTNVASGSGGQQHRERDSTTQNDEASGSIPGGHSTSQHPASVNVTDGTTPSTSSSFNMTSPPSFTIPENIPLIPPFPFMVFNVPPPMPPPEGLSEEELRRLEQDTRQGLEQRIRCLYTIQSMLDTSVIMMQQYCAAVAVSANSTYSTFSQDQPPLAQARGSSSAAQNSNEEVSAESTSSSSGGKSDETIAGAKDISGAVSSSTYCSEKWTSEDSSPKVNASTPGEQLTNETSSISSLSESGDRFQVSPESDSSCNLSSEQQILRQRRLERFSKNN